MLLKKILLACTCLSIFDFTQAQTEKKVALRPIIIEISNSDNVELSISKSGDNINVTGRGIRSAGVKGCDNCNVSGKITFTGGAEKTVIRGGYGMANKAVAPAVIQALVGLTDEKTGRLVKTAKLNADGSFSFTGVPKGTYKLSVDDNTVATGWRIGGE